MKQFWIFYVTSTIKSIIIIIIIITIIIIIIVIYSFNPRLIGNRSAY